MFAAVTNCQAQRRAQASEQWEENQTSTEYAVTGFHHVREPAPLGAASVTKEM